MKHTIQKSKLQKSQKNHNSSMMIFVIIVFFISIAIVLISIKLTWDSPTRQFAVDVQNATEDHAYDINLLPFNSSSDDLQKALDVKEVELIRTQINDLINNFTLEEDFKKSNFNLDFLEF